MKALSVIFCAYYVMVNFKAHLSGLPFAISPFN